MQFGVIYPQTELPPDPAVVRDFAQAAEGLGYAFLAAYEHVLGANPDRPGGWKGPYDYRATFLEPMVMFAYLAAETERIGLTTGVLVLPQRQTALVAKQAATLDLLCGGRLRLGVGLGWNEVEFVALGEDFHNRGRRLEEQVELLRRLWTEPLVTFSGRWHRIDDAGLNPLPVQRPIPIWFGGRDQRMIRRAARLADGWILNYRSIDEARPGLDVVRASLTEAGRDEAAFGIEARLSYGSGDPAAWAAEIDAWRGLGATHVSLNTMRCGLETPAAHLGALRRFAEAAGIA
jgi:probable F420-dependent oxidoreductase